MRLGLCCAIMALSMAAALWLVSEQDGTLIPRHNSLLWFSMICGAALAPALLAPRQAHDTFGKLVTALALLPVTLGTGWLIALMGMFLLDGDRGFATGLFMALVSPVPMTLITLQIVAIHAPHGFAPRILGVAMVTALRWVPPQSRK